MPEALGEFDPQVIVIGAGPAGLALAIELGSRSIRTLLVEKEPRTGSAPRAKLCNVRTREHLRRWGVADRLAEESPFGVDYPTNILFVTRLGGPLIARFDEAFASKPERNNLYSEHAQWIPQYKLESVLLEHIRTLPSVRTAFRQEFVDLEERDDRISVTIRDLETGATQTIEADYLVGADGARSGVRERIGARMEGVYGLSRNYNTIFEAPGLQEAHPHGPSAIVWQINKDVPSVIGPMDKGDLWFFMPVGVPKDVTFSPAEMADLIRRSTGIDLPYRILSSDEWVASRLQADIYSKGRAFLIGDACHLHPPYGGYGMNMGVADGADLGWKLAAVLQGWAAPELLETYDIERRPIHSYVMDEAQSNHLLVPHTLARDGIEDEGPLGEAIRQELCELIWKTKTGEFFTLGVILGYRYVDSPTIIPNPGDGPWLPSSDYSPSPEAGSLAPHQWLEDGSSLYDHFGPGFTMLVTAAAGRDQAELVRDAAEALGIPFDVFETSDPGVAELYQASLALIRPDQHICWRGEQVPNHLLQTITGQMVHAA